VKKWLKHGFDEQPFLPEYERRVVAFFDRYLLGEQASGM
jgi:predicted dienelactone hydrolase